MAAQQLTPEYLREALDYDPSTGRLRWKTRPVHHFSSPVSAKRWNTVHAGKPAGAKCFDSPYRPMVVNICGAPRAVHRLVWAIHYGEEPPATIDHINCDNTDNRITNLRACDASGNARNHRKNKNNTSGFKNVSWSAPCGRWRAYIVVDRRQKHLGLFDTPEEAFAAYCAVVKEHHGDFARTN